MTDQDSPQHTSANDPWDALARFVADESTPEERAEIQRQLDAAPARAALLSALNDALRLPEPTAPTSGQVESALAAVLARRDEPRPDAPPRRVPVVSMDAYRSRWRSAGMRAAAAVLVVAGAGLLWKSMSNGSVAPQPVAESRFTTPVGALDSLRLPDGTGVLLGPGSELAMGAGYDTDSREVTLIGDARFDVVHNEARPFIVRTAGATFRDIGTVFAIHTDVGNSARIVVTEGAVSVERVNEKASVTLAAGDRATVNDAGVHVERASATSDDMAWTTGKLVFRDAPVTQVTADVRRWFGLDLRVDSALSASRLNVTFDRASAASVGTIVAAMLGGELHEEGGILHVTARGSVRPR